MSSNCAPVTTLILPGLDGTGELLREFAAALPPELHPMVVTYPAIEKLGYRELEGAVESQFPTEGRCVLIGESFSGPLALRLAARSGSKVSAVALVATFVRSPIPFPALLKQLPWGWLFRLPVSDGLLRRYLAGPDAPAELLAAIRAACDKVHPEVLARRVREILSVNVTDELHACRVPLLYLGGTRDRLVRPETGKRLRGIRGELLCVELDAPHMVLQRCPVEAARLIEEFIRHNRALSSG
jgi:pimeloyl-ACP methyl ester carboxylesterase